MSVVIDASAAVALVSEAAGTGDWVKRTLATKPLAAPELMLFEAANLLRMLVLRGERDPASASAAHADLLGLAIDLFPYRNVARRAWELRHNLTIYNAANIALAELLDAPLVTLDKRLATASGLRCEIVAYPGDD